MWHRSLTPSITVTIGRHTRLYFAFVTTAPPHLDSPRTITLGAVTLLDLRAFTAESHQQEDWTADVAARLVLIDAMELAWQRAKYCAGAHRLLAADRTVAGLNTLQHCLWQRLEANSQVAA